MDDIEKLVDSLSKEAGPVRPSPQPWLLSLKWLAVAVAYIAVALAFSGVRGDLLLQLSQPWFAAELAALTGIFVTTALSAAVLAFPDLHQQRRSALAPVWAFTLFALVMFCAWLADNPPAPSPAHNIECTLSILLLSVLPSAGIYFAIRQLASTHPALSGMTAVLFAFSTGALWLRLYEQADSIVHVLEWHYLPMLLVGLLGWRLGKLLLKW